MAAINSKAKENEVACGCEICAPKEDVCTIADTDLPEKVYLLENLDCANCSAKMERKIQALPGVHYANISFTTKQLRLSAENPEELLPEIQRICREIESEVRVLSRDEKATKESAIIHSEENEAGHASNSGIGAFLSRELLELSIGGIIFMLVVFGTGPANYKISGAILAYVILGHRVIRSAVKNIFNGQIFDENFLMAIATIGAAAIGAWEEAVGVMLFYRIGEYFEERAVEKSRTRIMGAVDMRPEVVNLFSRGEVKVIAASKAKVGDILLVKVGERIPLDGVVVEGESFLDTAPITGESVPVRRSLGDEVVSGCVNSTNILQIRVEKVLAESMVTKILMAVENAAASKPKIDKFITRFARIYTPFVVAVAAATAIIPGFITGDWHKWVYTALTFLVISCPCALVLSVPLAFFAGIGAGAKRGILFKGGVVLETLKNCVMVIMDKTGTVTEGNFILQKVFPRENIQEEELLQLCASVELVSTHPIATSIVKAANNKALILNQPMDAKEIAGEGIEAHIAQGKVLCGNEKLMKRYGVDISAYKKSGFGTEVLVAKDAKYLGHLLIADTVKKDAVGAIARIKKMGLTTAMLTGDSLENAQAVASATGIDNVYAALLPLEKLKVLTKLRNKYGGVIFVGDGINDAPVLAGANVGAAMGTGADAAIMAADVVFMNSEMESIPQAIEIAKSTNSIAWQNVVFALVVKIAVMFLGLAGFASMWMAVFADTGVAMLCVINSVRILYK